jgi:hypothetical protein
MDRSIDLLRIEMDGRWSADDLGHAFVSLSDLYDLRLFLESLREDQRDLQHFYEELIHFPPFRHRWKRQFSPWGTIPWVPGFGGGLPPTLDEAQLSRLWRLFEPEERLEVRSVRYASPGSADLAGLGAVVGHIKDFVFKLIDRRDSRRQRELGDERAALENERIRLENARTFVALARDLGYADTDVRLLVAYVDRKQEPLVRLIEQQKIRGVSAPNSGDETSRQKSPE